jgi:hypothetical protein
MGMAALLTGAIHLPVLPGEISMVDAPSMAAVLTTAVPSTVMLAHGTTVQALALASASAPTLHLTPTLRRTMDPPSLHVTPPVTMTA